MTPESVFSFLVGGSAPVLEKLVPAGNGSQISVGWSCQPGKKLLRHFVIQWTEEPAVELWWQIVENGRNSTVITGEKTDFCHLTIARHTQTDSETLLGPNYFDTLLLLTSSTN